MKRIICHILSVVEPGDNKYKLKDELRSLGINVGEDLENLSLSKTLEAIYQDIFPGNSTQSKVSIISMLLCGYSNHFT
jgi:hypothetical protein